MIIHHCYYAFISACSHPVLLAIINTFMSLLTIQDPPTFLCRGFCPPDPLGAGFNVNWDNVSLDKTLESLDVPVQVLFSHCRGCKLCIGY